MYLGIFVIFVSGVSSVQALTLFAPYALFDRASCRRKTRIDANNNTLQCRYQRQALIFASKCGEDPETTEDEADQEEAYGKRSLSWTRRYRRLLPYESARKSVMELGLRSKQEWDEYVQDGKVFHGPYLPSRPDEMYSSEWTSWDEFLGLMRPYEETRNIVQNVLHLKTMEEYRNFVKDNVKRAEGLRIPALPSIVYKDQGWIDFEHFFGSME